MTRYVSRADSVVALRHPRCGRMSWTQTGSHLKLIPIFIESTRNKTTVKKWIIICFSLWKSDFHHMIIIIRRANRSTFWVNRCAFISGYRPTIEWFTSVPGIIYQKNECDLDLSPVLLNFQNILSKIVLWLVVFWRECDFPFKTGSPRKMNSHLIVKQS